MVILLGVVGAVVGEDKAEQVNKPSSQSANSSGPEEAEPDPVNLSGPEEAEPDPATPLGTLENPYPIGQAATFTVRAFGDADHSVWSLVVDEPGTDITESIASENMFNPSPDEGSLQFGVPVSLTLIEAGKEDKSLLVKMPAGVGALLNKPNPQNWFFWTEPQKNLGDRKLYWPRGRGWGGSSSNVRISPLVFSM